MKRDFDLFVPDNQIVILFKIVNQCSFDTLRITMIYEFAELQFTYINVGYLTKESEKKMGETV